MAALGRAVGVDLFPWQRSVMDDWMAVAEDYRYIHRRCVLEVPRQNGKTALVETRILAGVVALNERILYTAHDYSTVTKLFDRLKEFFGECANDPDARHPELNALVRSVRKGTGKEAIFFESGAVVYLSTRTKSAKRGYTVDVVICDEAQALTDEHLKAIMSTATTSARPQFVFIGTPPGPEYPNSSFADMRHKARKGEGVDDLTLSEWSADEVGDVSDRERWWRLNPSMGYIIDEDTIQTLRNTFSEDLSFAQECLGYWLPEKRAVKPVIPAEEWDAARREPPEAARGDVECVAVKFSPDGSRGAAAAAVRGADGSVHVEALWSFDANALLRDVAMRLSMMAPGLAQIVVDGKAHSADLVQRLTRLDVPERALVEPTPAGVAAACSMLVAGVTDGSITHGGQADLDAAVALAEKRQIGSAGGFGFLCAGDPAAEALCEACALAAWQASITKRDPTRRGRVA